VSLLSIATSVLLTLSGRIVALIKGNRYTDYEMFRITPEMVENIDVSLAKPKAVTMNYCQRAGTC
jgi:hypothetical protein